MRRKWKWTKFQKEKLEKVIEVLDLFESYKPLTLRQIYYQLVSQEHIPNTASQYTMLSTLVKHARIDKYIEWNDIEDRSQVFSIAQTWSNKEAFIDQQLQNFLTGYRRNLLQLQEKYIEVWIEKDALASVFTRICLQDCVPVVVCRGFSSVSFLHDFQVRLNKHKEQKPIMLYFGDFDPSGVEMLTSMETTLRDELDVPNLEMKRIALNKEDIFKYNLPHDPTALKRKDSRAAKHLAQYGELAVELDALPVNVLEEKIKIAIENELDIAIFNEEVEKHNNELDMLNRMKKRVKPILEQELKNEDFRCSKS